MGGNDHKGGVEFSFCRTTCFHVLLFCFTMTQFHAGTVLAALAMMVKLLL